MTAPTTGNGGGRGLPDRRAVRPAAGRLPGDGPAAGDRRDAAAHRGYATAPARRPAATRGGSLMSSRPAAWTRPTWPPSRSPGGRGSPRPPGDGPPAAAPHSGCSGAFCRALAGASCVPRRRPGGVLPRTRRVRRAGAAGLRGVPGPPAVPGLRHHKPDHPRHLGRADRAGTPRAAISLGARIAAGA